MTGPEQPTPEAQRAADGLRACLDMMGRLADDAGDRGDAALLGTIAMAFDAFAAQRAAEAVAERDTFALWNKRHREQRDELITAATPPPGDDRE